MIPDPLIRISIVRAQSENDLEIFLTMVADILHTFFDKIRAGTLGTLNILLISLSPIDSFICSVIACEFGNMIDFLKN
jgi:hypothetical protein